jgi:hypothetical protein
MTLKILEAITVRTDLREIWRTKRKNIHISGIFLKDAPSKMDFKAWSHPINEQRVNTNSWSLSIEV